MRRFLRANTLVSAAIAFVTIATFDAAALAAQQTPFAPAALTADDYARARQYLGTNTNDLVTGTVTTPTFLPDGRLWYRTNTPDGQRVVLIDPLRRSRESGADLAALGIETIRDVANRNEDLSPDGRYAAFIRDHDLWVRETATNREVRLSHDGEEDYGYATNNAGWTRSDAPVVVWSPDSRKLATFRHDGRAVGTMSLASTTTGHPELQHWKYPLPGDSAIFSIERIVIDIGDGHSPRLIRFDMPPDAHRSSLCDHIVCRGQGWADVKWSADSRHVAFVSTSRDHRETTLRVADAQTGSVRDVLDERVSTFFESGAGRVNWHVLHDSDEVIWFSQRDDWGHLYLYDLNTGELKNRITTGVGNVTQVLRVDADERMVYFLGVGREQGRDPYFVHFYRVGLDGRDVELLTPEDANHEITLAPDGRFFVDTYSTPTSPPVSMLRTAAGAVVLELERADITRLLATGWTPPTPFTVKARDGTTDLYGLMYRPTLFDSTKAYPIINHIYPGPQRGSIGSRSFTTASGDTRALAELGFVVVQIDGMGTPGRSKRFHEAYYGNMGDNTLPDQVTGMQQLAARHAWIDLDRAGIYGHSGGGYATAAAMFRYPDFFKVGVSQAGNHDNRAYEDDWAEKWMGLLEMNEDGTSNYDDQANQNHAQNLRGKLLLAHGTLDTNVPPYNTYLVVDALIRHDKDFDLIMFPNRGHGFGNEPYMVRRRWDYFVAHLMGARVPGT